MFTYVVILRIAGLPWRGRLELRAATEAEARRMARAFISDQAYIEALFIMDQAA